MSTTQELLAANQRYDALRARMEDLAAAWERSFEKNGDWMDVESEDDWARGYAVARTNDLRNLRLFMAGA